MTTISFPEKTIKTIVSCIEEAVGDRILEDIRKNSLKTTNSVPSRIWDYINTGLIEELNVENCSTVRSFRGPWQMAIVYEKTTNCIITFMRESRFHQLKKAQSHRNRMHYVDFLAKQFNDRLKDPHQQLTLLPSHTFSDEDRLAELVQQLLTDLVDDVSVVRNHVMVLFESFDFQLTSVRAVMVTPNLEIADGCDVNWSQFICGNSVIVEQVVTPSAPNNNPTHGLKLKARASERKSKDTSIRSDNISGTLSE